MAAKYNAGIIAVEIMPDVHLLWEVDPQFGIHRLVKNIKAVSSETSRKEILDVAILEFHTVSMNRYVDRRSVVRHWR